MPCGGRDPGGHFDFVDEKREWSLRGVSDLPKVSLPVRVGA